MDKNAPLKALLLGACVGIAGSLLLFLSHVYMPDLELHSGYAILNNQNEFDAFSTSIVVNHVASNEYTIHGSDFPYIAELDAITPTNTNFPYGETTTISIWQIHGYDHLNTGFLLLFFIGIALVAMGIVTCLAMVLFPKWATNTPHIRIEWVPNKKREATMNGQRRPTDG